jgi:hypothetical protein
MVHARDQFMSLFDSCAKYLFFVVIEPQNSLSSQKPAIPFTSYIHEEFLYDKLQYYPLIHALVSEVVVSMTVSNLHFSLSLCVLKERNIWKSLTNHSEKGQTLNKTSLIMQLRPLPSYTFSVRFKYFPRISSHSSKLFFIHILFRY